MDHNHTSDSEDDGKLRIRPTSLSFQSLNRLFFVFSVVLDDCPLCMEELDVSDKYFKPCPCGYQVSLTRC